MGRQEQDIHHEHKGTNYRLRPNPCACGQDAPAMRKINVKMLLLRSHLLRHKMISLDHFSIFDCIPVGNKERRKYLRVG